MNAFAARYDHGKTYSAHVMIDGGFQSDELWSTPIFQSLIELSDLGIPREEVDKIVVQSHFGLGADLKMRDMALSTVSSAQSLFPEGPHKDIFYRNFVRHGIIEEPAPNIVIDSVIINEPNNGYYDPGESITLALKVKNTGNLDANNVQVEVKSSSSNLVISNPGILFGDMAQGDVKNGDSMASIQIQSSTTCGSKELIIFEINYQDGNSTSTHEVRIGKPVGISYLATPNLDIPDNDENGVESSIEVLEQGFSASENLKVHVQISHTYAGDLQLVLSSPQGESLILSDRVGSSSDDIRGTYPDTLTPSNPLSNLFGQTLNGNWTLKAIDRAQQDVGKIESWGLDDITNFQCSTPN